jgi:small subunit ribosomal protein S16
MQRTGRKGHAMFRLVVQDARRTPTSGKIVAQLGSFDPHSKTATVDKEKASFYLSNGAQPSDRAALLLKKEGVKLPGWVNVSSKKKRDIRNPEKLRRNRPAEEAAPAEAAEAPEAAETAEAPEAEVPESQGDESESKEF